VSVRLARPISLDSDAKRRLAEARIRQVCDELAAAVIDLAAMAPAPPQAVELLSVEEAARRLGGIARSTLYQLMSSGAVRSVEVGGRRFVPSSEVDGIAAGRPRRPSGRGTA
jgi:excisionase family DNA binding protein